MGNQSRWQRTALAAVLGYLALGSLFGGIALIVSPEGKFMGLRVGMMAGSSPADQRRLGRDKLIDGGVSDAAGS